ncbi:capsular polysaccharide export protein [Microbulbifer donghaiensis]|uniref:Capsular polysaccharide export protein n=1 Tax=Microbulbifer donghaiensis TaxID=494016 RepID=A0A1M5CJ80_9GAMM|nr:capsular polysaccharide biosynthesis protein [Microbulbifer donghaiensis]SHF54825.1 capsular polysaccharide export protein [Microbulbifer donghaiensis]
MSVSGDRVIGYCSRGIARVPNLDKLLEAPCEYFRLRPSFAVTHIAGWGRKPTTLRARKVAAARGLPYLSIEDGFLRSAGLGVHGARLHSMVVDETGIYYDATGPSDLESLIADATFDDAELARAREAMALLCHYRLSKYNHAPDEPIEWPDPRPRILVVDQTAGDAAIEFGKASAASFTTMLESALREHPDAEVCVKVHPDVIAGKKRGHLLELARQHGCRLLAEDICPWALLDAVQEVYVVTSQFGFDALLAGKKVHCFGLPFFAGWGLTADRVQCERRNLARSLEQVFAAAYLRYSRYINPYTCDRCSLEDTIYLIAEQKRQRECWRGDWLAAGFSPWKRGFIPAFLGGGGSLPRRRSSGGGGESPAGQAPTSGASLRFAAANAAALSAARPGSRVVAWASSLRPEFAMACDRAGVGLWRMEDGFLRSVGLGADLIAPLSLVMDRRGIYYDASRPSDLEWLLNHRDFDSVTLARARAVREQLLASGLSKYNVGDGVLPAFAAAEGKKIVLVPGQVETDASIARGSPHYKTNRELLQAVRAAEPDAFIVYKPHPDVVSGGRIGELDSEGASLFDALVTDIAMPTLLQRVDEVHTLCSLSGFEALLRGRKVVTYGLPFYAGWGVTEDRLLLSQPAESGALDSGLRRNDDEAKMVTQVLAGIQERRRRKLTLDALVAGVLLEYPVYVDPHTGDHINVETAIALLQQMRSRQREAGWATQLYRWYRNRFLRR